MPNPSALGMETMSNPNALGLLVVPDLSQQQMTCRLLRQTMSRLFCPYFGHYDC